jgi:hypothetical protein
MHVRSQLQPGKCLADDAELFCTLVAGGAQYTEAAERAGFVRDYGKMLIRRPDIRQRVEELIGEPDKARLAAKYWLAVIRTEEVIATESTPGSDSWRANMDLHLRALDKLARLHGWLVERKQVSQVTTRVTVDRNSLEAAIRADIERLAPGAIGRLEAGESDLKQLAAGGNHAQQVVVEAVLAREEKANSGATATDATS